MYYTSDVCAHSLCDTYSELSGGIIFSEYVLI